MKTNKQNSDEHLIIERLLRAERLQKPIRFRRKSMPGQAMKWHRVLITAVDLRKGRIEFRETCSIPMSDIEEATFPYSSGVKDDGA